MRRMLFVLGLLCIASIVSAQRTYYYECKKRVDSNGVASKWNIQTYFTFVNGNIAYESDVNGNKKFSSISHIPVRDLNTFSKVNDGNFYYRGVSNGSYWFCSKATGSQNIPEYDPYIDFLGSKLVYTTTWDENYYILVSTDYTTLNVIEKSQFSSTYTYVFVRSTPTKPEDKVPELIH